MPPVALMPLPKMQFFDANGNPLAGGLIYSYVAGTTTPLATYTDSTGATPNTNPVVLDSGGFANIWLAQVAYKIVVANSANVTQYTVDNVFGLASSSGESLLNYQKSLAALTGNSADQMMYTYTIPASIIAAGKGFRVTIVSLHTTGSASVLYKITIGSASQSFANNAITAFPQIAQSIFMNDPSATAINSISTSVVIGSGSGSAFSTSTVDTTSPVVVTATFNVANTDQVTPKAFLIELIQ